MRHSLEIIVFVAGAALLSIEIVASRLLAPYFGNSVYVWGSCIGVFLAALGLGYALGGRLADRHPSPALFAAVVFAGGLLILPVPLLAEPVLGGLAAVDFGAQLTPLFGAIALFLVPSLVIGMVTPFAVRLRARDVQTMGRTAGTLYAIGTAGSIAGTLVTSFVLVDHVGVRAIVYGTGLALMAVASLGWISSRRERAAAAGGASMILVLALAFGVGRGRASGASPVIRVRESAYHRITISDVGSIRYLALDNHWQSAVDRRDPRRTVFAYTDSLHLPLVFVPQPKRATLIGLGGGTVAKQYVADHHELFMTVVELDAQVVRVAADFFDVRAGDRLAIEVRDGRRHLATSRGVEDIILTDAYLVDSLPVHLATREFFALARSRLAPGGIVASNVIGAIEGRRSRLFRSIYKTMRDVFRTVYVFPVSEVGRGAGRDVLRNIVVVATDEPRLGAAEIHRRADALHAAGTVPIARLPDAARDLYEAPIDTSDVPLLTDDFAPIDALASGR